MGLLNPVTTRRKRAKAGTFIDVSKSFIEAIQTFIDVGKSFIEAIQTFIDVGKSFIEAIQTFIDVSKSFIEAIQAFIDAKLIAAPACARLRRVLAINRHPAEPNEVDVQKYDCFRQ